MNPRRNGKRTIPDTPTRARAGRRPRWERPFLVSLSLTANVKLACEAARVARSHAYARRSEDSTFAAAWDEALETACDALELEARRRALEGTSKPVFYLGKPVGEVLEYSDRLLIFLLKAHRPEKYRTRIGAEIGGPGGGPIGVGRFASHLGTAYGNPEGTGDGV
jgi:hypothetical protein